MSRYIILFLCFFKGSALLAEEPFRKFTTVGGQSFTARVLSYEGQTFYLEGKDKKLYPVPYNQLSTNDQSYLRQISLAGKIPIGDPRKLVSQQKPEEEPTITASTSEMEEPSAEPLDGPRLMAQPKKKPVLRAGSFFAYKPVNLGQDPNLAIENKSGNTPKPGEPIDFSNHVLPILEDRCFSCHQEAYVKNGKTIHPKAGLALNTYELVMKGNLDDTVVTAGDVEDSYLYEVLTLDEDDDMFMPPKGGPLTPDQIDIIKRWIEEGAKPKAGGSGVADASGGISFHDHIFPILEERCLDCHGEPYVKNGRTIHPKAGLALDSYEAVLKGNLDGAIIDRGDHEESTLYVVITLDPDDSEIMPPKGDPLSPEEIELFKKWIDEGAKEYPSDVFERPKEEKVAVSLTSVADTQIPLVDQLGKRLSKPSKTQIDVASKTGALVTTLSEKHSMVRAEFSSGPSLIDNSAVGALSGIQNNISHLDLSRTKVTDSVMGNVKKMKHLTWLGLRSTEITDQGVKQLKGMQFLRYLNLSGTKVSDGMVKDLSQMKDLEEIYLWNSEVSEKGVESLRKALPDAKIVF
ncbi:MAG: c-type cytochrome domain-containing protein [Opitutae bacterium]